MKVYKVELMILDHDGIGPDGIKDEIENTRYSNHCISPDVVEITEREIGEWDDNHPLNNLNTSEAEFKRLFNDG